MRGQLYQKLGDDGTEPLLAHWSSHNWLWSSRNLMRIGKSRRVARKILRRWQAKGLIRKWPPEGAA